MYEEKRWMGWIIKITKDQVRVRNVEKPIGLISQKNCETMMKHTLLPRELSLQQQHIQPIRINIPLL